MSVISGSFRNRVRTGIEPIARMLGRTGVTPNLLTLIGFAIAILAALAASTEGWILAGPLLAVGAIFDLFDGALARATNTTSRFGAFMDSTFDRAGEAVVYIGIAIGLVYAGDVDVDLALGLFATVSAMAAAFLVSYTRAKSESLGFASGTGMASVGLAPREVRVAILAIGLTLAGMTSNIAASYPAGITPPTPVWWQFLVGALGLIAVLATFTTIQRILFVYLQSKSENQEDND
jgi:CDP-diacylglycerol--glycerol-3-phosphate 3-phosphatidyltransferase